MLRSVTMIASSDAMSSGSEAIRSRSTFDDGSDRASAWRGSGVRAPVSYLRAADGHPLGHAGCRRGRAMADASPWPLTDEERPVGDTARQNAPGRVEPARDASSAGCRLVGWSRE